MGEVIHARFGDERQWQATRERIEKSLVHVGSLFDDDEALMRAKSAVVYSVLREIVEDGPRITFTARIPGSLSPQEGAALSDELRRAVLQGVEATMTHAVSCLMSSIYDLCTSRLR